ncbi:GNAT family N-acetyltransferase [Vibrio viridaestus]|uniref:N-acetyltransferase n=1 Tax=Vibrio viridaestus TaxID=2487322 RepID=A0A3N9U9Q3_9VIBR|nr:N-acetyltransferase [Vibrio viridaestus]RQW64986.1 N-acetyltransferase [Vibrio viridaestus]
MELSQFTSSNTDEIIALFTSVFAESEGDSAGETLKQIVTDLFAEKDNLISFVAMQDERIIASICFSPLVLSNGGNAALLSPVAVSTKEQGKGIGQKLISYGLAQLKPKGIDFVFTYGDPNFYSKVGFHPVNEKDIKAPFKLSYPHGWQALSLQNKPLLAISASTQCVNALNKKEYW